MRVGINFLQTPIHVDILTSCHEPQMFFMASRRVNPFQDVFTVLCSDPPEDLLPKAATALQKCISSIIRLES